MHSGLRTVGEAVGSGLQRGRSAIAEALTRGEIPVQEEAFHDAQEEASTAVPPFFSPGGREEMQVLGEVGQAALPAVAGGALAAAVGATSFGPIAVGAIAGLGVREMYRNSGAHTEPNVTPLAGTHASMRHRVESQDSAPVATPQLTQEEQEIYIEVYQVRLENGATQEEADRFAMEAVERFREEQALAHMERNRFRRDPGDAEREREREAEQRAFPSRSSGSSGRILAVRPGPSGASLAERIVAATPGGNRTLGAAPSGMAAAARRRGGRV